MTGQEMFGLAKDVTENVSTDFDARAMGQSVGAAIGGIIGGPVGMQAGALLGGLAVDTIIPQHQTINGSLSGYNFIKMNQKPYYVELTFPRPETQKAISDYYCYYGVPTNRTETINYSDYNYQNHAYVQGSMQYNESIPLDKFLKIQSIFKRGVHILYA